MPDLTKINVSPASIFPNRCSNSRDFVSDLSTPIAFLVISDVPHFAWASSDGYIPKFLYFVTTVPSTRFVHDYHSQRAKQCLYVSRAKRYDSAEV